MNTYTINLKVEGLEADPEMFQKFIDYISEALGGLFVCVPDKDYTFHIQVPSDTNFFMLGILWRQFKTAYS